MWAFSPCSEAVRWSGIIAAPVWTHSCYPVVSHWLWHMGGNGGVEESILGALLRRVGVRGSAYVQEGACQGWGLGWPAKCRPLVRSAHLHVLTLSGMMSLGGDGRFHSSAAATTCPRCDLTVSSLSRGHVADLWQMGHQ